VNDNENVIQSLDNSGVEKLCIADQRFDFCDRTHHRAAIQNN
jgi:hypothetical protein